jgi:CubicO group peptidase (beta-lactamase class C family)
MARFMIAHLQNGRLGDARILQESTAREMHTPQREIVPHLRSWTLGFLPEDRNGHVIIGHGGDTLWFHSQLSLLLDDNVGFLSRSTAGAMTPRPSASGIC